MTHHHHHHHHHHRHHTLSACLALSAIAAAALSACSKNSDPPPPAPTVLTGTAAIGAPMAGATITVTDGDPTTADPAPVTAAADGTYTIDVSSQRAPLFVRASGTVDGEPVQHSAVVPTLADNTSNRANVTPLTSGVATLLAPGGNVTALATPATLAAAATAAQVGNASQLIVNTISSDAGTAALLGSGFNPLSTAFAANGSGIDAVLTRLNISTSGGNVSIANNAAPAGDSGAPAAVTLTPALVATPNAAPVLPPSVPSGNVPTVAEMTALGAKLQACLALPISQRVTLDASGNVTAVLGACNFVPATWRSNGRTFAEDFGQFTLTKTPLTGARVGSPTIEAAFSADGITDAKTFQHPYCNSGPCVVARFALVTASGRPTSSSWVLGKVNGAWDYVGNQRPYRVFVEPRLNRKINMNRNGAAPGSTVDPYFLADRHESLLRLVLDLTVGNTSDIRAVRFTGPGLPAAGVVQVRSQRCGTDDRMAIINQVGSTRVIGGSQNGVLQFWTGGSSAEFVLAAARLDGTPLPTPVPVNTATSATFQDFAPAGGGNPATVVPAYSRYKVELFRFSANSDIPDEIIYLRIGPGAENPASGATLTWPTMDATYTAAHVTPTGAQAGALTSFANTLSWTIAAGSYVTSGYLFGQNFATATNSQNETASYALRGRIDHEPQAYGDTTAAGWRFASPVAGTALSTSTATTGTNPNPRCAVAQLPQLVAGGVDYREAALFTRGPDRQVRQAIWIWED